jgi:hypothetical protein
MDPNLAGFLTLFFVLSLYLLPAIVAGVRHHHQRMAIGVLTLLGGWTGLGWLIALVWASTAVQAQEPRA